MRNDRDWMYARRNPNGTINEDFVKGVETFITFALNQPGITDLSKIRCPCAKCHNRRFQEVEEVRIHLFKKGFIMGYYEWDRHGEQCVNRDFEYVGVNVPTEVDTTNPYHQLILDVAGPEFVTENMDEAPNPTAQKFYDMLNAADEKLWEGCKNHSQMSAVARLLYMKSEHHFSERCYDDIVQFMKEVLPENNKMVDNFYSTKKLVQGLGLPVEKIDCCMRGCMIYWGVDSTLTSCKFCGHERFKRRTGKSNHLKKVSYKMMHYFPLKPRLQRMYALEVTAPHMRWHKEHLQEEGKMCHPSDSEAWKHFDREHPSFSSESRNVRIGLCTDGFQPFGHSGQQYSSWPVIVTPYNLPPWMCMKDAYMFLSVIIPGPTNPKHKVDVFIQPLIAELNELWEVGVLTYDASRKQNFTMKAALMWTISDFPAYSMLSGWSTAGKHACPCCMEHSQAFTLTNGRKTSWFDNHRKFLPPEHPFRRNKKSFLKNRSEVLPPPPLKSGERILYEIEELGLRRVTEIDAEAINGPICKNCGWKKRNMVRRLIGGRISDYSSESSNHVEDQLGQSLVDGSTIPEAPNSVAPQVSAGSALTPVGRIYIYLRGDLLEPSEACSRAIRKAFEERQDYEGFTWKKVSEETKNFYFSEFKKSFHWDEEIYLEKQIRKAWNKKASARYSDLLSDVKKGAVRPKYMEEQTYGCWLVYWASPEARRKAEQNAKNRRSGANGIAPSTHNAGSITHFKYGERLAVQLKRKAFPREVYVRTHTKKGDGKTFTNQKCKDINETIETNIIRLTENNEVVDEVQVYYNSVVGMNGKKRVFGLGSLACEYYKEAASSSSAPRLEVQQTIRGLECRLDEQDQMIVDMQQQHELPQKKLIEDMQQQFAEQIQQQIDERIRLMIGAPVI